MLCKGIKFFMCIVLGGYLCTECRIQRRAEVSDPSGAGSIGSSDSPGIDAGD